MLGVFHVGVARYQRGIQLSGSLVGLDVQDALLVWLAIDVPHSLAAQLGLLTWPFQHGRNGQFSWLLASSREYLKRAGQSSVPFSDLALKFSSLTPYSIG